MPGQRGHKQLESGELVKSSRFYTCGGRCSIGWKHRSRYIAMIPLSRYDDDDPKRLNALLYNVVHKKQLHMAEPQKSVMMALTLPPDQAAVIDEIVKGSSVFQSREHFIQVAIDWTIMSDLSEVVSKLVNKPK